MLTLDQLISEATALPDATKAILIDKILESMTRQIDRDISIEGVKKAQERIAEIESGTVQTISGDSDSLHDTPKAQVLEDFRQAWHEAITEQGIPIAQLWKELENG